MAWPDVSSRPNSVTVGCPWGATIRRPGIWKLMTENQELDYHR